MDNDKDKAPQLTFSLRLEQLRPLIVEAVTETLAQFEAARPGSDRICYSDPEAAELVGLHPHQLRDERRRGGINACRIVGGNVRYLREDLVAYATRSPWKPKEGTAP